MCPSLFKAHGERTNLHLSPCKNAVKIRTDNRPRTDSARLGHRNQTHPIDHWWISLTDHSLWQLYLQARMRWRYSRLLRPFLQIGFLWLALGVAVSRISDYKHHWSDTIAGALLGIVTAIFTVGFVVVQGDRDCSKPWFGRTLNFSTKIVCKSRCPFKAVVELLGMNSKVVYTICPKSVHPNQCPFQIRFTVHRWDFDQTSDVTIAIAIALCSETFSYYDAKSARIFTYILTCVHSQLMVRTQWWKKCSF